MSLSLYYFGATKGTATDPATPVAAAAPSVASVGSTVSAASTDTISPGKPSGLAEGDLMVAFCVARDAPATATFSRSGWAGPTPTTGDLSCTTPLWKVADAGDVAASSFTFTASATQATVGGVILRVTGAASSGHFAASAQSIQSTAATPYDCPASGAVTSGDYLAIVSVSIENDHTDMSPPSGYTERVDYPMNYSLDTGLGVASKELTGITSEDPGGFTDSVLTVQRYHTWTLLVAS